MGDKLFDEWRVYQKLLDHDYMDHRAFFSRLEAEVRARFEGPVSVLDLGCGDAQPVRALLDAVDVRRYVGIDASAEALARARVTLDGVAAEVQLIEGDLTDEVAAVEGPFDLVVASFSLHHVPAPPAKEGVLRACRERLGPRGLLAVIDVFRDPGEERETYLERWIDYAGRHYQALEAGEKAMLFEHVRARDFPETLDDYRRFALGAGFARFDVLLADEAGLNHLTVATPARA